MIHIGQKIKELASKNNLDIPRLAEMMGKTKQAVYDMISKPDVNTSILRELSDIFRVPITYFFQEEEIAYGKPIKTNITSSTDLDVLRAEILLLQGENRVLREQLGLPARKETATRTA